MTSKFLSVFVISGILWNFLSTSTSTLTSHHRVKRLDNFPNVTTNFNCRDRPIGFYADEENCQIFYMCDAKGKRISFLCPNETYFSQQFRVCAWKSDVDCEDSSNWYYLNDLTYEPEPEQVRPKNKPAKVISSKRAAATGSKNNDNNSFSTTKSGRRYFSRRIYY